MPEHKSGATNSARHNTTLCREDIDNMEMICPGAFYLFTMSQPRPGSGGGGSEGAAEDEDDAVAAVHIRKKGNRIR